MVCRQRAKKYKNANFIVVCPMPVELDSQRIEEKTLTEGNSDLMWAALEGDANRVQALIDQGADPNSKNAYENTPLSLATTMGNIEVVLILLAAEADPNSQNYKGDTPLIQAVRKGYRDPVYTQVVSVLLKAGADPNKQNDFGTTPLMVLAGYDYVHRQGSWIGNMFTDAYNEYKNILELLILAEADLDLQEYGAGRTALLIVTRNIAREEKKEYRIIADALVESGANSCILDNRGYSALDYINNDPLAFLYKLKGKLEAVNCESESVTMTSQNLMDKS